VGVTAGRTVGTAVTRNRAKRLLREVMRHILPNIASNLDLILIARTGLASATLEEVSETVTNLLKRAKIITPVHES
jgi:ribonuclease P protein component